LYRSRIRTNATRDSLAWETIMPPSCGSLYGWIDNERVSFPQKISLCSQHSSTVTSASASCTSTNTSNRTHVAGAPSLWISKQNSRSALFFAFSSTRDRDRERFHFRFDPKQSEGHPSLVARPTRRVLDGVTKLRDRDPATLIDDGRRAARMHWRNALFRDLSARYNASRPAGPRSN